MAVSGIHWYELIKRFSDEFASFLYPTKTTCLVYLVGRDTEENNCDKGNQFGGYQDSRVDRFSGATQLETTRIDEKVK
jgi:hypothetical protein